MLGVALRLLTQREHAALELTRKLEARQFASSVVGQVVEHCQQNGWQSDQRYAEAYVRLRAIKGYGPRRIQAELKEKGVKLELIASTLDEAELDWLELAESQLLKRIDRRTSYAQGEKAKQQRFLVYRGFESEQIRSLMNRFF